ncbi:hypothetical protein, partial [Endozoicomonas sp. SESOKO3]|uniref:hypothetical protein n=1 Tax=Endozoicomonas sp. SESOKO3 TaxID=2828744 RepID=UPI0021489F56
EDITDKIHPAFCAAMACFSGHIAIILPLVQLLQREVMIKSLFKLALIAFDRQPPFRLWPGAYLEFQGVS